MAKVCQRTLGGDRKQGGKSFLFPNGRFNVLGEPCFKITLPYRTSSWPVFRLSFGHLGGGSPLTMTNADQDLSSSLGTSSASAEAEWFGVSKLKKWFRRGVAVAGLAFLWWFIPPVYKLANGPVVVTRYAKTFGETKATVGPGLKGWVFAQKVSRHTLHAVVAAEDGHFYEHHGLDLEAIRKSYEVNKRRQRYVRGASTISQQVVKMAFLGREKTLTRKMREAAGTLLMELFLPKEKILEWYINLAEFGDNVYGIQEGAWHYFRTKPELLTIEQSIHLALVLPSPNNWSKGLRRRALTAFGHRRYAQILNTMRGMGYVTPSQWTVAVTRGDFGRPVAGYAQLLAAEEHHKALCPGGPGCPQPEEAEDPSDDDFYEADEGPEAKAGLVPTPLPSLGPAEVAPNLDKPTSNGSSPAQDPSPRADAWVSPSQNAPSTPRGEPATTAPSVAKPMRSGVLSSPNAATPEAGGRAGSQGILPDAPSEPANGSSQEEF